MQKLKKSPVSIVCYVIAALALIYCFYVLGTAYKTVAQYYAAYNMKPQIGEIVTYVLQTGLAPLTSAITLFMAAYILDAVRKLDPNNYVTVEKKAVTEETAVAADAADTDSEDASAAETMPEYEDGVVEFEGAAAENAEDGEFEGKDTHEFTEFVESSAPETDEDMKVEGETAGFSRLAEDLAGDYTEKAEAEEAAAPAEETVKAEVEADKTAEATEAVETEDKTADEAGKGSDTDKSDNKEEAPAQKPKSKKKNNRKPAAKKEENK
jgi:hypothetical protein